MVLAEKYRCVSSSSLEWIVCEEKICLLLVRYVSFEKEAVKSFYQSGKSICIVGTDSRMVGEL